MWFRRGAQPHYLLPVRDHKLGVHSAIVCTLLVAGALAGCGQESPVPSARATATATAVATAVPLPPAPAGVYVVTLRAVEVLSLADGTLQHTYPYNNPGANSTGNVVSPPVISGGAIYFAVGATPSDAATVMALRASDGSELWRFPMPSTSSAPGLSVVDGVVYVGAYAVGFPSTFYALNARGGHMLWKVQESTIRPPATVAEGVVYLSVQPDDGTQHLLAVRATDGARLWSLQIPSCGMLNTPAVDAGMVYASCDLLKGSVAGVRASDGKLLWQVDSLGLGTHTPAAANGLVYVGAGGCGPVPNPSCALPFNVYAFNEQQGGAARWRTQGGASFILVSDGVLYCDLGSSYAALDPSTGAVRLHYTLPPIQRLESSSPTIAHGVIYLQGDEQILAISARTGMLLWRSPTHPDPGTSPEFGVYPG